MLRYVLFDTAFFEDEASRASSQKRVLVLLNALTWCNQLYLREHPETPLLYQSGVEYKVPAQFEREYLPEVDKVRAWLLDKKAPGDVAAAFKEMADQLGAGEHFREIPRIIENGGGDCFPAETRVLRLVDNAAQLERIDALRAGDKIWGRGRWSEVRAIVDKGVLPVDGICVEGDADFLLTRDHKVFVVDGSGSVRRISVEQLEPGMSMIRPTRAPSTFDRPPTVEYAWGDLDEASEVRARVLALHRDAERLACVDVTTDDHYVYLPDDRVVVSQCDNLASWRAAELRELGIMARPYITWRPNPEGGTVYHVIVAWPGDDPSDPEKYTSEDPSLLLGMAKGMREADRQEEERKLGERTADYISGLVEKRRRELVQGVVQAPSDFGKGPQYSPTFFTDDAYEDWSPTRPQAFYYNPFYPGGNIQQQGPLFNTLWRGGGDEDYDSEDRFDGDFADFQARHPELVRRLWSAAIAPGNAIRRKLRQIRARRAV